MHGSSRFLCPSVRPGGDEGGDFTGFACAPSENKKGTLSLICGVEYSIFWQINDPWCTQFLPFYTHLRHSFCRFTPLLRHTLFKKKFVTVHIHKNCTSAVEMTRVPLSPQQQEEEKQHLPCLDLSAAPQIKIPGYPALHQRRTEKKKRISRVFFASSILFPLASSSCKMVTNKVKYLASSHCT